MLIATAFLVMMFLVYSYVVFEFMDKLLENPRLKKIYRIPVGIINTLIAVFLTDISETTSFSAYIVVGACLFVEFIIFYKDKLACSLFCMLSCLIHIMAVRALCVAGFAVATHSSLYDVVHNPFLLVTSMGVTVMCLNIIFLLVIKLVPAKGVRIINQHNEQLWFMIAWMSVFGFYLLVNAKIYSTQNGNVLNLLK